MTSDTKAHEAIRRFLEENRADQTAFLAELIRNPADNPPGDCAPHAEMTARMLADRGLDAELHPVPEDLVRENGMTSATNLVVRERFGDGPVVSLNAHGDAVPAGDGWTVDAYGGVIKDGKMYGRGAAVSKSDFATYAYALMALKASGAPLAGTVELHLTYDEEVSGFVGPKWILDNAISKPDYAICAGFTYFVATGHNGCLQLDVEIAGRSAHAAMPESGVDALVAAAAVLDALYAHRESYRAITSAIPGIGSPNLVVGRIEGGTSTNVVPGRVVLKLDRRIIPDEDPAEVEASLRALIRATVADMPDIGCTIDRALLAEPLVRVDGTDKLADIVARHASDVIGEPIGTYGVPIFTDARHYSSAGIPTVMYGAGPRTVLESNVHKADEHVDLGDLAKATEVVARALAELLAPAA
jgi:acetylornithine deacetylase/succinyl-diaminopimelate desuccinylase-like protein